MGILRRRSPFFNSLSSRTLVSHTHNFPTLPLTFLLAPPLPPPPPSLPRPQTYLLVRHVNRAKVLNHDVSRGKTVPVLVEGEQVATHLHLRVFPRLQHRVALELGDLARGVHGGLYDDGDEEVGDGEDADENVRHEVGPGERHLFHDRAADGHTPRLEGEQLEKREVPV